MDFIFLSLAGLSLSGITIETREINPGFGY